MFASYAASTELIASSLLCAWVYLVYTMIKSVEVRDLYKHSFTASPELPIIITTTFVMITIAISIFSIPLVGWQMVVSLDVLLLLLGILFNFYWALYQIYRFGDSVIEVTYACNSGGKEPELEYTAEPTSEPETSLVPNVQYPSVSTVSFTLQDDEEEV